MEWLTKMTAAINHIEENLTDDIMYDEVAKLACCSMHQFGRVFSYIVGISLYSHKRLLDFSRSLLFILKDKIMRKKI